MGARLAARPLLVLLAAPGTTKGAPLEPTAPRGDRIARSFTRLGGGSRRRIAANGVRGRPPREQHPVGPVSRVPTSGPTRCSRRRYDATGTLRHPRQGARRRPLDAPYASGRPRLHGMRDRDGMGIPIRVGAKTTMAFGTLLVSRLVALSAVRIRTSCRERRRLRPARRDRGPRRPRPARCDRGLPLPPHRRHRRSSHWPGVRIVDGAERWWCRARARASRARRRVCTRPCRQAWSSAESAARERSSTLPTTVMSTSMITGVEWWIATVMHSGHRSGRAARGRSFTSA